LPKSGKDELTVYNVEGRLVKALMDEVMQAGKHRVAFDGSNLPSGIYFARLNVAGKTTTKRSCS